MSQSDNTNYDKWSTTLLPGGKEPFSWHKWEGGRINADTFGNVCMLKKPHRNGPEIPTCWRSVLVLWQGCSDRWFEWHYPLNIWVLQQRMLLHITVHRLPGLLTSPLPLKWEVSMFKATLWAVVKGSLKEHHHSHCSTPFNLFLAKLFWSVTQSCLCIWYILEQRGFSSTNTRRIKRIIKNKEIICCLSRWQRWSQGKYQ